LQKIKEIANKLRKIIDALQKINEAPTAMSKKAIQDSGFGGGESPLRVAFPPDKYSREAYALIVEKCQEWGCSPAEAQARLLDELAAKRRKAS
jgi:hypothetical protein